MIGQVCLLKPNERAFFTYHIFLFSKLTSTTKIKMPARSRQQQEKHNSARRRLGKAGKKAIFSTYHVKAIQPELIEEASKIYDFLFELYPRKHDLTKTDIYMQCMKNESVKKRILRASAVPRNTSDMAKLQPVLNIPLMQIPPASPPLPDQATSTTIEEIPPVLPILTDDETATLIRDLQQDPALKQFFQDDQLNEVSITTENPEAETATFEDQVNQVSISTENPQAETTTFEDEIAQIIKEEFEALGRDLPDIPVNDEQFFQ